MAHYELKHPNGFDPQVAVLLATLEDGRREWRDNFGKPSIEAITWQPYPGSYSIGALLLHIADTDAYWFETFCAKKARPEGEDKLLLVAESNIEKVQYPVPPAEPIEWYFDLIDQIRARSIEAIKGIPPETLLKDGDFSCNLAWVVAHVVEHDSYHGGQAVMLHELYKQHLQQPT